jgi:hypothetical protein
MEEKVPEKPAPMTPAMPVVVTLPSASLTSVRGIPATSARTREMAIIARKGCTLNLEIATIIRTTASTNAIIRGKPVIEFSSFEFVEQDAQNLTNCLRLSWSYFTTNPPQNAIF